MKARAVKFTPRRRGRRHQHARTTELFHGIFIYRQLHGRKLFTYSDGGPCDLNRQRKRRRAKAQREARKAQRQ